MLETRTSLNRYSSNNGELNLVIQQDIVKKVPRVLHADDQNAEDAKIRCRSHLKHRKSSQLKSV